MSLTTKRLVDEFNRRDLSPVEWEYGEDLYDDGPWPSEAELAMDESLYEDDLDHEGHWFEIWGED